MPSRSSATPATTGRSDSPASASAKRSVYLSDEAHDYGAWAPQTVGHSTSSVVLTVDDVDSVYRSAVEAGGTVDREPTDQFDGSRRGWLWDPFGQHWAIGSLTGETPGT